MGVNEYAAVFAIHRASVSCLLVSTDFGVTSSKRILCAGF